ncbi:hypothetical protein LTR53_010632, partial [Teratosphaeriaceae sp. CCFEE 6253]
MQEGSEIEGVFVSELSTGTGLVLADLEDLAQLIRNSRAKRNGAELPRGLWREGLGCWVLYSFGELERLLRGVLHYGPEGGEEGEGGEREGEEQGEEG